MQLIAVPSETYAQTILPQTFELWGAGRTFETYVDDFMSVAHSRYGRRGKHTIGFEDDGVVGATCKVYERELRWGEQRLRSVGIGAVYTPDALRSRGYASAMLGALLDAEAAAGTDVAYLFSDIRPQFYERLGFRTMPSRLLTIRASSLGWTPCGAAPLGDADWPAVQRCFEALDARRTWSLTRTSGLWTLLRRRWSPKPEHGVQTVHLVARKGRSVRAYVLGRRVMRSDAFVVDEYGFASDEDRVAVHSLLRSAAGDLARVTGWLPPEPARNALPRGSVKGRRTAILMIAAISPAGRAWWKTCSAASGAGSAADPLWSADHV